MPTKCVPKAWFRKIEREREWELSNLRMLCEDDGKIIIEPHMFDSAHSNRLMNSWAASISLCNFEFDHLLLFFRLPSAWCTVKLQQRSQQSKLMHHFLVVSKHFFSLLSLISWSYVTTFTVARYRDPCRKNHSNIQTELIYSETHDECVMCAPHNLCEQDRTDTCHIYNTVFCA